MNKIIEVLADGEFHSGEKIGESLGISRTAVWKQIAGLDKLGLSIESVKGKGYRFANGIQLSLLNTLKVEGGLSVSTRSILTALEVHQTIGSTNTHLMKSMSEHLVNGKVCLAELQTGGRGRRGRVWVSPYAGNIYMSVSQVFQSGVMATEGLSLAVGVMVADALEAMGVDGVELKWPNDIYWQGKKLAGILLELVGDAAGECAVVVGLGLNVNMAVKSGETIDQDWVDLQSILQSSVDRSDLVAKLLNSLLPALNAYESSGFSAYIERWSGKDYLRGHSVMVSMGDVKISGVATGVNSQGALLVRTPMGEKALNGGEVSVRRFSEDESLL